MGKEVRKPNLSPWFTWAPRGSTVSLPLHCDCPWETPPWRQDGERWTWAIIGNDGTGGGKRGQQVVSLLLVFLGSSSLSSSLPAWML